MEDRLTILPKEPPALTMLYANALARAFRAIQTLMRLGRAARLRVEREIAARFGDDEIDTDAEGPRFSWLVRHIADQRARADAERATAAEVPKARDRNGAHVMPPARAASDHETREARQSSRG